VAPPRPRSIDGWRSEPEGGDSESETVGGD
jgi:hypothetical protein